MPKREVVQSITLGRGTKTVEEGGKKVTRCKERFELKPGQVFDFTDAELAEIMRGNPNAISKTTTIDLSADEAVVLKKTETQLAPNETAGPATGDKGDL